MSDVNTQIINLGKILRNRVYYDIYEPLNYNKIVPLILQKEMNQKLFLQNNLYKKVKDESIGFF